MIKNVISKRYAKALSGSIGDESTLRRALDNLKNFGSAFETDRQLERFFSHPGISVTKKNALVGQLCDRLKAENVVRNLLGILVQFFRCFHPESRFQSLLVLHQDVHFENAILNCSIS